MFGYIIANRKEMSKEEVEVYRSYYCGLCYSLKENYGSLYRMTLNYDLTFVAILLSSLYEAKNEAEAFICPIHPLRKTQRYGSEYLDYAADMTVLLSYYKAVDDAMDENKKTAQKLLKKPYEEVRDRYSEKDMRIQAKLEEIHALEEQNCQDIDEISGLFGEIMAEILVMKKDEYTPHLYRMGYYLGKFIYLMDAAVDVRYDRKHHLFNPLKEKENEEEIRDILEDMMSMCVSEYYYLPVVKDVKILENVLYSGVWLKYEYEMSRRKAGEKKDGSV